MSRRSVIRQNERARAREQKRMSRSNKARAAIATGAAIGAVLAVAPAADAATFPVSTTTDSGPGSLRQAILDANAAAGLDQVTFSAGLSGAINLTAELEITDPINIQGPGKAALAVDGGDNGRVFHARALPATPGGVTISGLTIRNGAITGDSGAGVFAERDGGTAFRLNLTNVAVNGNEATNASGGGVAIDDSSLTVTDSTLTGNKTLGAIGNRYGAGIYVASSPGGANDLEVIDSTVNQNNAANDGGGIYATYATKGDVLISGSTIANNIAGGDAGGASFANNGTGALEIHGSTISGNQSGAAGGGVWLLGVGGGATIADSTIANNTSVYGGGVSSYQGNDGPVAISNSTIAGNTATGAVGGGGIFRYGKDTGAPGTDLMTISSTIVSGNKATTGPGPDLTQPGPATGSPSVGNSLIGTTSGAVFTQNGGNLLNKDPLLGPLAANGGATQTLLPSDTSPVINAGLRNGESVDQRDLDRTVVYPGIPKTLSSDGTDIGAVELQITDNGITDPFFSAPKKVKVKGKKVKIKVKAGAGEEVDISAKGSITVTAKKKKGEKKPKPQTVKLKSVAGESMPGELATLTLSPSKKGAKKVVKTLKKGGKAKASIQVVLTDAAANTDTENLSVKLKAKKKGGGGK